MSIRSDFDAIVARSWLGTTPAAVAVRGRSRALDSLRGLAVLLMVADHCLIVFGGPVVFRYTLTRAAMPIFFVLAGHLCRRLSWRTARAAYVGLVIPVVVPWIDRPNVLLIYAVGAVLVVAARRWDCLPLLAIVALGCVANGWPRFAHAYPVGALVALMAVGAMLDRTWFFWAARLPRWLAPVGRYPVTVYAAHLLLLQAVIWL